MGLALTTSCVEKDNMENKNKIIDGKEKAAQISILNAKELELLDSLLEEKKKYKAIANECAIFSLCVVLLFLYGMSAEIRGYFQRGSVPTVTFVLLILLCFVVVGYVIKKTFDMSPQSKLNDLGLEKGLTSFVTCQIKELKERIKPAGHDEQKLYTIQAIQHI